MVVIVGQRQHAEVARTGVDKSVLLAPVDDGSGRGRQGSTVPAQDGGEEQAQGAVGRTSSPQGDLDGVWEFGRVGSAAVLAGSAGPRCADR